MKKLMLFVVVALLFTGCATPAEYRFSRIGPNCEEARLEIVSDREFPNGIVVEYDRLNGTFILNTDGVTNTPSALDQAVAGLISDLPKYLVPAVPLQPQQ